MEEGVIAGPEDIAPDTMPDTTPDTAPYEAGDPDTAAAADPEEAAARWPDASAWLPGSLWLHAVPVILLLFLWLFYPVILVLICIILALWWLG